MGLKNKKEKFKGFVCGSNCKRTFRTESKMFGVNGGITNLNVKWKVK